MLYCAFCDLGEAIQARDLAHWLLDFERAKGCCDTAQGFGG